MKNPHLKNLINKKRCIIIADGFFEWKKLTGKPKSPFRICKQDDSLFAIAGLWDTWTDKETGELTYSFTIITTDANELISSVHDRMPLILKPEDEKVWIDTDSQPAEIDALLAPYVKEDLKIYEISDLVNSPKNDVPEILEPVNPQD